MDITLEQVERLREKANISYEEAKAVLPQVIGPHTTVLVKASRGMAFEELVEYLKGITQEA